MLSRTLIKGLRSHGFTAVRANSHWNNLAQSVPGAKQAEFQSLVAAMAKRKEAAESVTESADINWESFTAELGPEVVGQIRAEYEATQYTDFSTDAAVAKTDMQAAAAATVADLNAQQEKMGQYCADAEEQLDRVKSQYTTLDTTANAVFARHPELDAKYEAEIARHDYDIEDVPVLDVDAKRAALIEERWDAATMGGSLTEATQKEILGEIASMTTEGANDLRAGDLPADVRAKIDEFCEYAGHAKMGDAELERYLHLSTGTLSADEKAVTEEAKLFEMMEHFEALGLSAKSASVRSLHEKLAADGKLEVCEEWRARERERANHEPPVAGLGEFCPSELEGKTEEEVMAMANEAASNKEYRRGTQILMHHYRSTGEIDDSTDTSTFSGKANYMDKMAKRIMKMVQ